MTGPDYFKEAVAAIMVKHQIPYHLLLPGPGIPGLRMDSAARDELFWLLRQRGWSWPRIGQLCERNHVSAMVGAKRHCKRAGVPLEPEAG